MIHVFIVGSKGIPAQYGGFETFVENLTAGKQSNQIKYHGAPGRIFHVGLVLEQVENWAKANLDEQVIVCILGCRIGPLLIPHARKLHKLGAKVFCNPDGECEIIWTTRKKPEFMRVCAA